MLKGKAVKDQAVNLIGKHLQDAFAEFEAMQADHQAAFECGRLDDLIARREKRERAFARLQFYLDRLWAEQPELSGTAFCQELRNKIKALLEGETILMSAVAMRRQELQGKLTAMRKGKKALVGYGPGQGGVRSARFLSSKT